MTAAGVPGDHAATPRSRSRCCARTPPQVPAVPEPVLARHFGRLARRNHNLHEGMYPLGSCTMKYNPVVDEQLAWLDGFAQLHPYQDEEDAQGALQLMWELDRLLASITGMARMSLQPAAGAHGEWTGLRMIQAYHADRGDTARTRVLIPDSAHGTNPASAAACGLDVVTVKSNHDGTVDVDDFSQHLDDTVAAVMLTNPNTLGVFEKDIVEIARLAHEAGALVYYDGANLNALVGIARPGDMGFDVVHLNLHKTFSTPHGGGGPGRRAGRRRRAPHRFPADTDRRTRRRSLLPRLRATEERRQGALVLRQLRHAGARVRVHPRVRRPSAVGRARRRAQRALPAVAARRDSSRWRSRRRACTSSWRAPRAVGSTGLRAMDVAKRLLDYGVYAPTVYFPLTVPEALMFEPTETESKQSLDALAGICAAIVEEAERDLAFVQTAPHETPVSRVDEVRAARHPVLRWTP